MISTRLIRVGSLAFAMVVGSLLMAPGASAAPPNEGPRGPGKMQHRDGHHRHLTKRQKAKLRHWMKHHRRGDHHQDAARPRGDGPRGDFRGPQRGDGPRGDFRGPRRGEGPQGEIQRPRGPRQQEGMNDRPQHRQRDDMQNHRGPESDGRKTE